MRLTLNIPKTLEFMDQKGWSETDLANKIGCSRVQVYRVLRGQRAPGNEFIAGLLSACREMGFNDLFIFEEPLPFGNEVDEEEVPNA
ncbi:transcriptional regulator with XRE-family HTH domain [Paenibacillus rhizosphaerae]|uniref:Transcriptional regulator with XRE-family HTH domain n=1 Tax=Paenibacillus rhizosphaerae TaxID=297318 RepID=A0A839TY15_9BACL|nr:helix-turn-helix transcriptional regulator [Paenibacillus rhizosphaerae]MBB3132154.1 transcriptional regulator with XRE-family HTH domain [Paenibacillus rhizosphaerae]